MRRVLPFNLLLAVLLAACVTVNVYFPAAAAQSAADQIIDTITQGPKEIAASGAVAAEQAAGLNGHAVAFHPGGGRRHGAQCADPGGAGPEREPRHQHA